MSAREVQGKTPARRATHPPAAQTKLDEARVAELQALAAEADRGATVDLTRLSRDDLRKSLFR